MNWLRRLTFSLMYLFKPPWDTGVSPPELMQFIHSTKPGRALDLGCGTGTNVITLARHGWDALGVDFIFLAIRKARQKALAANVPARFQVGDVSRLDGSYGRFDLILDMGCFHSLASGEKQNYIGSLEHLLDSDGTFLLYVFFKDVDSSGPGLLESELQDLNTTFELVDRQDGTERGLRASAWLTYHKRN